MIEKRFRGDNTEGYSQAELDDLNDAFERIMADEYTPEAHADGYYDSIEYKSWQDFIAEALLANFDRAKKA